MFPIMLSKGVPKSTSLCSISFAQSFPPSFPLLTYINEPKGRHSLLIYRDCYIGEPPKLSDFSFFG